MDGEETAGVAAQAVGDGVVGGVGIRGEGGDAHHGADDHVLVHRIGGRIGVADGADVELVLVRHRNC